MGQRTFNGGMMVNGSVYASAADKSAHIGTQVRVVTYATPADLAAAMATAGDARPDDCHQVAHGELWYANVTGVASPNAGGCTFSFTASEVAATLGGLVVGV